MGKPQLAFKALTEEENTAIYQKLKQKMEIRRRQLKRELHIPPEILTARFTR